MKMMGLNVPDKTFETLVVEASKRGICLDCLVNAFIYAGLKQLDTEDDVEEEVEEE